MHYTNQYRYDKGKQRPHLASADGHEDAALTLPDGRVVVRHGFVKQVTSTTWLADDLLEAIDLAPHPIALHTLRFCST